MLVLEFKAVGKPRQQLAIDEAIRTAQFVRNKCLRLWMDKPGTGKYDLSKYCAVLAKQFSFANTLNSQARQAAAERAWSAISRFYDNCKRKVVGKKGYPKFKKHSRSVEYKTTGWKLVDNRKRIEFTDGKQIGSLKLKGTRNLNFYQSEQIKRVRLIRRADGYYVQFCVAVERREQVEPTGNTVGVDVGLADFYTDSEGCKEPNPRFLRTSELRRRKLSRRFSRTQKGANNRQKARNRLARLDLKISRQRKDHAVKLARCVVMSNDFIAYEDLSVKNMVRNHCLAKSISDAGWYQFRTWVERFGTVFGRVTVAVAPQYTSQRCSDCGVLVKKSLSTRTHSCACGCRLDRDENAARNILAAGLRTVGHTGTWGGDAPNASGDATALLAGFGLSGKVVSGKEESHRL
ncbi:MAG: transposase [Cyanobacteria bacterium J06648_11]